ncbi:hypothetical protein TNCV_9891 [Trichonephila clavipes]|nr:hypothetical protein TNCV_9891 [Trichonephila clavipes]
MKYAFIKSLYPKLLWTVGAEATSSECWRIYLSSLAHPLIAEVETGGVEIHPVSGSGNFPSFPSGRTRKQQQQFIA